MDLNRGAILQELVHTYLPTVRAQMSVLQLSADYQSLAKKNRVEGQRLQVVAEAQALLARREGRRDRPGSNQ